MKKFLKILTIIIGGGILIIAGYLIYLFASYNRIPDNQSLNPTTITTTQLEKNKSYRAMTYNIGYGSYPPSYSFFMDGGTKSIADSAASVKKNLTGIVKTSKKIAPTLSFYQEVDADGDRSRHVDQVSWLTEAFPQENSVFGENYHSAYLFYPFTQPIGQATSGLVTLSQAKISKAQRYSLPIETNFNKFFDLDRAFTASYIPVKNGKELVAVNIHLSAYTKDQGIQKAQLSKLFNFIKQEYKKGNYVLVAGDFNHDVLGNSPSVFNTSKKRLSWTHPFPKNQLPKGFSIPNGELAQEAVASARNLNEAYDQGETYTTLIDGFIVSDNLAIEEIHVADTAFKYSDHNPVYLDFRLK